MKQIIKLSEDSIRLLKDNGSAVVNHNTGKLYMFLPFWFTETEEDGVYEMFNLGSLPKELKDLIDLSRCPNKETVEQNNYPLTEKESLK